MNTTHTKVKIVVPVYSERLYEKERKSLHQTVKMLGRYPIVLLAPEGMDISAVTDEFPTLDVLRVTDEWLGSKNGIAGYNCMMLSREFYEMFSDCEYILICQTDAWIFRDELEQWCDRGYDYVGAPWPKRKVYDNPFIKCYLKLRKALFSSPTRILRQEGFDKVGNGGLSLRRVSSFIAACDRYAEIIAYFKAHRGTRYNEDWFWAIVPKEFVYPSFREALDFSFDVKPEMCFELTGGRLPFGCHGWNKRRMYGFWQPIIEPDVLRD